MLIFVFAVWPGYGTEMVTQWVVGITAVLILIIAWTGVECKPCRIAKQKARSAVRPTKVVKKKKRR